MRYFWNTEYRKKDLNSWQTVLEPDRQGTERHTESSYTPSTHEIRPAKDSLCLTSLCLARKYKMPRNTKIEISVQVIREKCTENTEHIIFFYKIESMESYLGHHETCSVHSSFKIMITPCYNHLHNKMLSLWVQTLMTLACNYCRGNW